jgi:carboxymethylenebutenolidase
MTRPQTPVVTREMIRLYDEYTHLTLDRRGFMDNLARLAGGSAAAAAILPLIAARPAAAQQVAENDARLTTESVTWTGASGPMLGYLALPIEAAPPLPGVVVIHENRGLNAHIRDVTRRMALEGFVALAPDLLSPAGGTPADEDMAREMIRDLDPDDLAGNLVSTADYLRGRADTTGAVGVIGFCWGGGMAGALAVADPQLRAAVPFYGNQPPAARVPEIRARMMMHYAGLDERINAGIPAFRAALDAAGTDYVIHLYEGANHAFLNDTSAARHDPEASALAWQRTVAFLRDSLVED